MRDRLDELPGDPGLLGGGVLGHRHLGRERRQMATIARRFNGSFRRRDAAGVGSCCLG